MRVLVLGDGILGSEIVKQTGWDYISRKKDGFDITNSRTYCSDNFLGYDAIINCIANTNTYSEDRKAHWDVNYAGLFQLVNWTWLRTFAPQPKFVQISSDYVLTNSVLSATEEDVPVHGQNWYSYTKLLAEALIELTCKKHLICRCTHKPFPYPYDNAYTDQKGNFDYVNVIAEKIIALVNADATGLYNIGTEYKSVYDLARKTKAINEVAPSHKPLHVPADTSMDTSKMKAMLYGE